MSTRVCACVSVRHTRAWRRAWHRGETERGENPARGQPLAHACAHACTTTTACPLLSSLPQWQHVSFFFFFYSRRSRPNWNFMLQFLHKVNFCFFYAIASACCHIWIFNSPLHSCCKCTNTFGCQSFKKLNAFFFFTIIFLIELGHFSLKYVQRTQGQVHCTEWIDLTIVTNWDTISW